VLILGLQLFWASFGLIGAAQLSVLKSLKWFDSQSTVRTFIKEAHPLAYAFICFSVGIVGFAPIVVAGCLLEWPTSILLVTYLILLGASLVWSFHQLVHLRSLKRLSRPSPLLIIVILVLTLDYFISLRSGGWLQGDAQIQLAQINLFAHKHLTLSDPFFGSSGVIMPTYSTNLLNSLEALAVVTFHTTAAQVWFYSDAFFRLVIWLSIFTVAWTFLDSRQRRNWSYIVLLLLPVLYGREFANAELHNQIVIAWMALFLIGLRHWYRGSPFLMLVAAFLISVTHPLDAAIASGFLVMALLCLSAAKKVSINKLVYALIATAILGLSVLLQLIQPHKLPPAAFNDSATHGPVIKLVHYDSISIQHLSWPLSLAESLIYLIIAMFVLFALAKPDLRLRLLCLVLVLSSLFFSYKASVIGMIGYFYLIYKSEHKHDKLLIFLAVTYLGLFLYDPLFWAIAKDRIPHWTIARISDLNIFAYLAPVVGMLTLLSYLLGSYKKLKPFTEPLVAVFFVGLVLLFNPSSSLFHLSSSNSSNRQRLRELNNLASLAPLLSNQKIFSDDLDLPMYIPDAVASNVLIFSNEANLNPAIDITRRKQCAYQLTSNLQAEDLQAAGVTRIVTDSFLSDNFANLLRYRKYITQMKKYGGYTVYRVNVLPNSNQANSKSICSIPLKR
jgi:hypothetical protein